MTVSRRDFEAAVAAYWGAKQTQNELSKIKNMVGAGTAGSVRSRKHFDTIAALLAKFFLEAGDPSDTIRVTKSQGLELPGYYPGEKPWLGYFFIMEDAECSRSPVKIAKGAMPVDRLWLGRSYQERFAIFCERLVSEGLYDAVCYITSSADNPTPNEPMDILDWRHFSAAISARLTYLQELGLP